MWRVIYWYPFGTDLKDKTKQKATKSRETKEADLTTDGRRAPPPPLQLPTPVTSRGSAQRPVILNDRQQQRRWNLLLVVFFSLSFIIHTYLVLKQNKNVAPTRSGREGGINPPQPSLPSAISEVPC